MKTIVFFGPSIAESEVRQLATVTHAPPIKRGDLAAAEDYDVFVILDGEFGQNMSVSPKEILGILEKGKTVTFHHRAVIHTGMAGDAKLEDKYKEFAKEG